MPNTNTSPFTRLAVDHLIVGGSRVWWKLEPNFTDPEPHVFQLQVSTSGQANGRDWRNVGESQVGAYYAFDDERRLYGKTLLTHYRVALTTPVGSYVSAAVGVEGEMTSRDLILAREIMRKERVRGNALAWKQGVLLKRLRYGPACTKCRDAMTGQTTDGDCTECNGTGRQVGYHPPTPLCVEFLTQKTNGETQDPTRGPINDVSVNIRCLGFPMLNKADVWVDGRSDERWYIDKLEYAAPIRGVPIIVTAVANLLPYTHKVYSIPVDCDTAVAEELPGVGVGCAPVDHDYGGTDELQYLDAESNPIAGADVIAFRKADFTSVQTLPTIDKAVAATTTDADGRWVSPLLLEPGNYVLVFRKANSFGPNTVDLTVTRPAASASSGSSAGSNSFWDV